MANGLFSLTLSAAASILGVAATYVPRQETDSTSTTPTASSSPIFFFIRDGPLQAFTCQPFDLYWVYSGPRDNTINLYATNVGVSQRTPSPSDPLPTNVTVTLGINIDPSTLDFRWLVNVPQGWYIFSASMPSQIFSSKSAPFYVQSSNDTSCISDFRTPTNSSNTESTPSPVAGASRSENISIGIIVGGCVGLVIVIATVIIAFIWFKRGRQRKPHGKGEYPNATHHWKELGSADSRGALRGDQPRYHPSSNNSMNHSAQSDEGAGADKCSIHSKLESTALSCEQDVALAGLPVLTHQSSRSRMFAINRPQSSSSLNTSGPSTSGHSPTPERRLSVRSNRRSLDLVSYPPTSPIPPAPNSSQPSASIQIPSTPHEDSRPSPQPASQITAEAMKQANRQSFGRKRKPVPVYDGEEPSSPSVPPLPTSPVSPSSSPLEAFLSASPTSTSIGHYVTRNHTVQESGHPDLALKGNFAPGDKPVHYLIPDMPMSQH